MKHIPLSKGFSAIVDDDDYECLSAFRWHAVIDKNGKPYAARVGRDADGKRTQIKMHRQIMGSPDCLVDHESGDTLDNRKENLRNATPQQNSLNRVVRSDSKAKAKGVHITPYGKFRVQFQMRDSHRDLGTFTDMDVAAHEWNKAAVEHYGSYTRLNPVGTDPREVFA